MVSRPKLLFLSHCLPYPPHAGVTSRTYHILRQLVEAFDIALLAFSRRHHQADTASRESSRRALEQVVASAESPVPIASEHSRARLLWDHLRSILTRQPYTAYQYRSAAFRGQLERVISRGRPDLVHLDAIDLNHWVPQLPSVPTTCTHHDIESHWLRRRADHTDSRSLKAYIHYQADLVEKMQWRLCPRFAANVVVSELDAERLATLAPGSRTVVAPNGVDTQYFTPQANAAVVPGRVVFVGPTYVFPNRDAVDYLLSDIWPRIRAARSDASLVLVGWSSDAERARYGSHAGVTSVGHVPDIRPLLAEACCCIVPIRVGGGTRIKILDAWASGKAVVSTSLGSEGLRALDEENILVRDTP